MEVKNRFNGLDLIDRVPEELWIEVPDLVHEAEINTIPMEKKCKEVKRLSEEALQIAVKKGSKKHRKKAKIYPFECRIPKNSTEK